jgi:hypothetical protein
MNPIILGEQPYWAYKGTMVPSREMTVMAYCGDLWKWICNDVKIGCVLRCKI